MRGLSVTAALTIVLSTVWFSATSCSIEEVGIIAGDYCELPYMTACDADGLVLLQCADGVWQPLQDCLNGCTEENGTAECIGQSPMDNDTADIDKPNLPENDAPIVEDVTPTETESPAGDEAAETDDIAPLDEDITVADDAAETDDVTPLDEDIAVADEDAQPDDAAPLDEEAQTDDAAPLDEDVAAADEDGLVTDVDTAPTCTSVTLNGTLLYNNGQGVFFGDYTPTTGSTSLPDQFKIYFINTTAYNTWYDLGTGQNNSLNTCQQCLFIGEDWDENQSKFLKWYFATDGRVRLIQSGLSYYAAIEDAVLSEAIMDFNNNTSTLIPGGTCIEMPGTKQMLLDL